MKSMRSSFLTLLILMLVFTLFSCAVFDGGADDGDSDEMIGGDGNGESFRDDVLDGLGLIQFTIVWDNAGGQEKTYTVNEDITELEFNWATSPLDYTKNGYTFKGVFTKPDGKGTQVFGISGNIMSEKHIKKDAVLYAHWIPGRVVVSFEIPDKYVKMGYTFEDGTAIKQFVLKSNDDLSSIDIPTIITKLSLSGWKLSSGKQVSDGEIWRSDFKKVSDLPLWQHNSEYVPLNPDLQMNTCTLTLHDGVKTTKYEIKPGNYLYYEDEEGNDIPYLTTKTFYGQELVGWAYSKYETVNFVSPNTYITSDMELYAIWKDYRPIYFYGVTEDDFYTEGYTYEERNESGALTHPCAKNIYKNEPIYLLQPERDGYIFAGWYADSSYTTPASPVVRYEDTASDYYAKWIKDGYDINVYCSNSNYTYGNGPYKLRVSFIDGEYKADVGAIAVYSDYEKLGIYYDGKLVIDIDGTVVDLEYLDHNQKRDFVLDTRITRFTLKVFNPNLQKYLKDAVILRGEDGRLYVSNMYDLSPNEYLGFPTLSVYKKGTGAGGYRLLFTKDGKAFVPEGEEYDDSMYTDPDYDCVYAIYEHAKINIRYEIPEGFLFPDETEYISVHDKIYLTYYIDEFDPEANPLTPVSDEYGVFKGWYHEYKDSYGNTVVIDELMRITKNYDDRFVNFDIRYDEEKEEYYIILKARIEPQTPSSGEGGEGEGEEVE